MSIANTLSRRFDSMTTKKAANATKKVEIIQRKLYLTVTTADGHVSFYCTDWEMVLSVLDDGDYDDATMLQVHDI